MLAQREPYGGWERPESAGADITLTQVGAGLRVEVEAPGGLARIGLRWKQPLPAGAMVVGDAWERTYGDLEWRGVRPERPLPWLYLAHDRATGQTSGAGVEVRGGTFAFWTVDTQGVSLWLDLRAGDSPGSSVGGDCTRRRSGQFAASSGRSPSRAR